MYIFKFNFEKTFLLAWFVRNTEGLYLQIISLYLKTVGIAFSAAKEASTFTHLQSWSFFPFWPGSHRLSRPRGSNIDPKINMKRYTHTIRKPSSSWIHINIFYKKWKLSLYTQIVSNWWKNLKLNLLIIFNKFSLFSENLSVINYACTLQDISTLHFLIGFQCLSVYVNQYNFLQQSNKGMMERKHFPID